MPDTNTHPELPPPACIVTNVGNDKPQSFMLAIVHGVALAQQPVGSTLSLYTAEQVRAAILADRGRGEPVATVELLKSLRAYADSEYIKGLNVCKTNECLGEDQKMTFGTFGKAELEAHRKAARHFGAHFGIHEAIRAAASIGADGGSER